MKNIKAPKLVTIAILTMITAFFGACFEVYRLFTQKPTPPVAQEIILPLDPTLDQTALNSLQGRMYLDEVTIGQTIAASPTPVPAPTAAPTPIPSEIPTESASPTPEAGLETESPTPTP